MSESVAPSPPRPPVLLIVGATAAGKSSAAVDVAEALGGEIVSLDSRQIYRGLDIGTAKPTLAERRGVAHHLLDVAAPDEIVPLPVMVELILSATAGIIERGRLPVLVGGTGQYVRALREGWAVPTVPPDDALRAELAHEAEAHGPAALHARLAALDSRAAAEISPANVRRVIRALEVALVTGAPFSSQRTRTEPRYDYRVVGLHWDRVALYKRIDARVEAMLELGLRAEVAELLGAGYDFSTAGMSGVGYREWAPHFLGDASVADVAAAIRADTRRLARSQGAWFRADDATITWLDASALALGAPARGALVETVRLALMP